MTITKNEWDNYIQILRDINDKAAEKIVEYINKYGIADTKALIDYAYGVISTYATASAALSAEMYDALAELEGLYLAPAEMAELANYGDVAKAINGTLKTSENAEEIASAAARWVKMAASDTTLHNAIRDGAEFAWIPSGMTCPFCIMLASRGWQRASKDALKNGHAEHIHSNCDCQYTIRHNSNVEYESYHPEEYLSMYRSAEGRTTRDRLNSMRRTAYAEDKATEGTNNDGLIDLG